MCFDYFFHNSKFQYIVFHLYNIQKKIKLLPGPRPLTLVEWFNLLFCRVAMICARSITTTSLSDYGQHFLNL